MSVYRTNVGGGLKPPLRGGQIALHLCLINFKRRRAASPVPFPDIFSPLTSASEQKKI